VFGVRPRVLRAVVRRLALHEACGPQPRGGLINCFFEGGAGAAAGDGRVELFTYAVNNSTRPTPPSTASPQRPIVSNFPRIPWSIRHDRRSGTLSPIPQSKNRDVPSDARGY
jgi:hypothetical protein